MNNLINTNTQRSGVTQTQANNNNGIAQQQAFTGQSFSATRQPPFNTNILQLLLQLIQQLIQLIQDEQPTEPEQPQDQTLNPDDATRSKLAGILGVPADTIKVTDRDGNGQLSVGDLVESDTGQSDAVRYELTDLALRDINGQLGAALALDPAGTPTSEFSKERLTLNNIVGVQSGATDLAQGSVIETVFDSDSSGQISAGDVVAIRSTGIPPLSVSYVELTADQVQQFENQAYGADLGTLNPDDATRSKLAGILGVPADTIKVTDRDGNGQLSVGDLVEGTALDDVGQDVAVSYPLTALALKDINGELEADLVLPSEAQNTLRDVLGLSNQPQPRFIAKISDSDGSGKLSAGDVVAHLGIGIPPFSTEYIELTADQVQQFEDQVTTDPQLPVSVSGGNVIVGSSPYSNETDPVPNDRVITIQGRNYSVGFLKQQVDDYANSSYAEPPDGIVAAVAVDTPWGGASLAGYASQFESYVRDTFPLGDPDVVDNPPVRYEGSSLIVNGQAYQPQRETLPPLGSFAEGRLLIQSDLQNHEEVRQALGGFDEVTIAKESELDALALSHFTVDIPANYLTQWKAALANNLPDGSNVFFNRIFQATSEPGVSMG